jgi:hypothetical protein
VRYEYPAEMCMPSSQVWLFRPSRSGFRESRDTATATYGQKTFRCPLPIRRFDSFDLFDSNRSRFGVHLRLT